MTTTNKTEANTNPNFRQTISIQVENEFGVLGRVISLFSQRGYNIESLCVAPTIDAQTSRITLVTIGSEQVVDQIVKQLEKMIAVRNVANLSQTKHVDRELALIKVAATAEERRHILEIVEIFRAKVVDVSEHSLTVEVAGDYGKVQAIQKLLDPFGIIEMARSGNVSLRRGKNHDIL